MPKLIDLTGHRYGRLVVIKRASNKGREVRWECQCDCGNKTVVSRRNLRSGGTLSCGCYNREQPRTHGMSRTKFYHAWKGAINRCKGHTENTRKNYNERGISVCERWETFENFREDMYESYLEHVAIHGESNTTLDRVDNDKGYSPENCRWATYGVQTRNRRFPNKYPGVTTKQGKWKASIGVNGIDIHLGTFETFKDALKAREKAEEKYWEE